VGEWGGGGSFIIFALLMLRLSSGALLNSGLINLCALIREFVSESAVGLGGTGLGGGRRERRESGAVADWTTIGRCIFWHQVACRASFFFSIGGCHQTI
jgi:hypothetical protein